MLHSYKTFQRYLQDNLPLYIFVSVLFMMGVVFGALMVNSLTLEQRQDMASYLGGFFQTMDQGLEETSQLSFLEIFAAQFKWILFIWLFGLSVIGLPLILILDFLKGVLIGFSIGYLVGQLSWKGLFFAFVSIAPQNLILIPVILISSVTAISFSIYMIRNKILQRSKNEPQPFKSYVTVHLSLLGLIVGAVVIEAFLTPLFMKWAAPLML